ncbi:trichothecene c-15 hydroxylase [Colletotrichum kahawae]|uniref:Trichothecene c-15 hydroxylase n=1 Tax=Colletotrichum kahawae TaxID=34407 RepID=A0AAD9YM99_COLKA|nr:trichothecene c-15 hydroxylase [Colletotrichum kahawae]
MDMALPTTRLTSLADSYPVVAAVSAAISVAIVYFIVLLPLYNILLHPLRKYPGPKLWAASQIPWLRSYTGGLYHVKLRDMHEKYGPVIRVGPNELSFTSPEAWQAIMGHPLRDQEPMIRGYIDLLIQRLHENSQQGRKAVDICAWFNYTTFDIIGDLTFGEPFGCLQQSAMHPWVELVFANVKTSAMRSALARFPVANHLLPFFVTPQLVRKAAEHKELTREKVSKRLTLTDARPDLVHGMIVGKGGLTVSREELNENSEGLIIAGSETTATALSGAIFMLTTHPTILKTLADEIRSAFTSESEMNSINTAHLPYLQAVLEETLRFFPPAPNALPRITPPEGNLVLGEKVPGNTVLSVPHWAMYHSTSNFSRPDEFIPNRWLDDPQFASDRKECMNVFSFGPRNCIGKNLAYVEMRMFLARVIWNFDIELAAQSMDWLQKGRSFSVWAKHPLMVHLTPRPVAV